jgi:hypothetical protein
MRRCAGEMASAGYFPPETQSFCPATIDEMKKRRRRRPATTEDASYTCDACGEEIVIPIDLSAGESQEYIEDCPVCCRPNVIHIEIREGGEIALWAEEE